VLHLFVFTNEKELSEEARSGIQAAFPRPLGKRPEIIGVRRVEGSLPDEADEVVREACLQASREKGLRFNPRRDEVAYSIHTVGADIVYGVGEIYIARYAIASVLVAGVLGFALGLALGVTTASVWLLTLGFGGMLVYVFLRGPARNKNEGWFFAVGPLLMMSWVAGFIVRGLAF
jgi:hypothetical protein